MTIKVDEHGLTVQAARPSVSQTIAVGGGSIQSTPFSTGPTNTYAQDGTLIVTPNNTLHVRLVSTSDCWVAFGANPTATIAGTTSILLPAGIPEYFWVYPGERIATTQNSAAGSLNVSEMVA